MSRLVHVGSVVADIVLYVPALPEAGGDVFAEASQVMAGGGFNVMVAAARQGLAVAYGGRHGSGPFGDLARTQLAVAGIDVLQPSTPDTDTGFAVALVDKTGERTFATSLGAESELTAADLDRVEVRDGDLVYLSGYGLADARRAGALAAWTAALGPGCLVLVDPGPLVADIAPAVLVPVLERADWWSCNLREATLSTGLADPLAAAAALSRLTGRRDVVVRTGADGCVVAQAGARPVAVPGFPANPVDTNGAGDAHVGVFVAGLLAGLDPVPAARRANAGAALAVTRRGPATAPTAAELDAYLATHSGSAGWVTGER